MKIRPLSHQLEDESRNYFTSLLPKEWVFRGKSHDYGVDGEIEIFDQKNESTGKLFYIQLKSTAKKPEGNPPKTSFDANDLSYLTSLPNPTLLVFYISETKGVFWFWAHSKFSIKPNSKSFSIPLSEGNKWEIDTAVNLEREYDRFKFIRSPHLRPPLSVSFSAQTESAFPITQTDIYLEFQKENIINPGLLSSVLSKDSTRDTMIRIHFSKEETIVFVGGESSSISLPPLNISDSLGSVVPEIMVSIGILLGYFGHHNIAIRFYDKYLFKTKTERYDKFLSFIGFSFYETGGTSKYAEIVDFFINKSDFQEALLLILTLMKYTSDDKAFLKRFALSKHQAMLEKTSALVAKGAVYYNIGQCCFSLGEYKSALHYYRLAKIHDSSYLKRDYFLGEIGGVLFELGKFNFSSRSYKAAQDIKKETSRIPCYADALMHSGQYNEALRQFEEYDRATSNPKAFWLINKEALKIIIGILKIEKQNRNTRNAINEIPGKNEHDMNILAKPLYQDALFSTAWWNYGIHFQSIGDYQNAFKSFFVAAAVNRHDKNAWFATILYGVRNKQAQIVDIIDAFYELYGEQGILDIEQFIKTSTKMPEELQKKFIEVVILIKESILSEKKLDDAVLFRLHSGDKTFEIVI